MRFDSTITLPEEDIDAPPRAPDKSGHFWMLFALMVLAAGTLIVMQAGRPAASSEMAGLPLPPFDLGGWINTEKSLTHADLRGKVVLLNFWSTSCPACIRQLPTLAAFHRQFRDQDVLILSLTPESDTLGYVKRFVETSPGFDWPVGYGAGYAFELMGVQYTPTYILYDRTGKSVWGSHTLDDLEQATIEALAKKVES